MYTSESLVNARHFGVHVRCAHVFTLVPHVRAPPFPLVPHSSPRSLRSRDSRSTRVSSRTRTTYARVTFRVIAVLTTVIARHYRCRTSVITDVTRSFPNYSAGCLAAYAGSYLAYHAHRGR